MKRRGKIFRLLVGGILLAFFMCPFNANAQGPSKLYKATQKVIKVKSPTFKIEVRKVPVAPVVPSQTTLKDITTVTGTKQSKVQIRDIKPFLENSRIAPLVLELNRSLESKLPTRNNENVEQEDSGSDDSTSYTPQNLQKMKETIQVEWIEWMQKQIEEAPPKNYRIGKEKVVQVQLIIYDNYEYCYAA